MMYGVMDQNREVLISKDNLGFKSKAAKPSKLLRHKSLKRENKMD